MYTSTVHMKACIVKVFLRKGCKGRQTDIFGLDCRLIMLNAAEPPSLRLCRLFRPTFSIIMSEGLMIRDNKWKNRGMSAVET